MQREFDFLSQFEDDGCTLFPDVWRGVDLTGCCAVHDAAFATGTSVQEFLLANLELFGCVASAGAFDAAILMLLGVMTGGALFFFFGRKRE